MKKQIFSLLILLLLVLPMLGMGAAAAETSGTMGENIVWNFDKATGTITFSGSGELCRSDDFDIQTYFRENNVEYVVISQGITGIGDGIFTECASMLSVEISETVVSIGESAFTDCGGLTEITIPGNVRTIGGSAFWACDDLAEVTICEGVTDIGVGAFSNCEALIRVTIPESVTYIADYVFIGCNHMTDVVIPESIAGVGAHAFGEYRVLQDVYYGGSEEQWGKIAVAEGNDNLLGAEVHYNALPPAEEEVPMPPAADDDAPPAGGNPFTDVAADAYYAEPVLWAVNNGITNGLSADTFGPDATCTRGQIVTFLWRAKGCPEPTGSSNPFWDVSSSDYFYKAVLWAVEKGITSGMGDGTFAPGAPCTRGQVATFLWRACGQPASSGSNSFTDLTPGAYYYDAVLWAVANGVTNGMGDCTFAPDAPCTRGQIVTFLYRAMV